MSDRFTVGLEGLPFSGKSSSADRLTVAFKSVSVANDYHDLMLPQVGQLSHLPATRDSQAARIDLYRELDRSRWAVISQASCAISVLDRTPLSIAAYNCAVLRASNWYTDDGVARVDRWALDATNQQCDAVIYLHVETSVAVTRHERFATLIDMRMRDASFLDLLNDAYARLLAKLTCTVIVVPSNGTLDEVVRRVETAVEEIQ